MNTFWKSLAQIAQGQLFIGGHLSPAVAVDLAKRAGATCKGKRQSGDRDHSSWPRLAIPH